MLRIITDFLLIILISLHIEGGLQPSRRRSLFTLATYMLIFSARAGSLPELIPILKASLTEKTVCLSFLASLIICHFSLSLDLVVFILMTGGSLS